MRGFLLNLFQHPIDHPRKVLYLCPRKCLTTLSYETIKDEVGKATD